MKQPGRIRQYLEYKKLLKLGVTFKSPLCIWGETPKIHNEGTMKFGEQCSFGYDTLRSSFMTIGDGVLEIGDYTFINQGIDITASKYISIGSFNLIGDRAIIMDTDFHQTSPDREIRKAAIIIGHNCWIASRVTILPGVSIGDHSVIAAGSIVTKDVPPKSIIAGNPAKVIRQFECDDNWIRNELIPDHIKKRFQNDNNK
jgi:acetyltransferase-like isoleucine patch superfamily enzyme